MTSSTPPMFDAAATARLTPYPALVDALAAASLDYAAARIASPERLVVPLNAGGIMLSMPAAAPDLAIHKLVNVCPANAARGLPTIHGQVMACDADSGAPLFVLDGPTVTGRRTAAISMLAVRTFKDAASGRGAPHAFLLIGTGTQAAFHVDALGALYPHAQVYVQSRSEANARAFCAAHRGAVRALQPLAGALVPAEVDVVIALTTSRAPLYDEAPRAERLVIGVGAFTPQMVEIGARTVLGSALYVDDPAGARHEAGDLIQAGVDWANVQGLAALFGRDAAPLPPARTPVLFKSVGCAAWDLAACRVARATLAQG
jgi:1-piperideine-2-carboxylate/1-pyrroline-2-carboxylate reductase [NAD(P)H]